MNRNESTFGKYFLTVLMLSFLFSFSDSVFAQEVQDENTVKCNLIFRLTEFFNWPRENNLNKFTIAVFEDETQLYPHLLALSRTKKIKNKPVEIKKIKGSGDLSSVNVIYIDPDRSMNSARYYENIKGKNILFITDQCENIEYTMINLIITKENKLSFEINKRNLEVNKFFVPNDLLIMGGSQLEIKAVFDETQKNLRAIQEKVKKQQDEIENQKKIIANQQVQVENQKQTIGRQTDEIAAQRNVYEKLRKSVDSTSQVLKAENAKIDEQQIYISMRDEMIKKQESKISDQLTILTRQLQEIEEGKKQIENQTEALKKQGTKIESQKNIIALSVTFLIILVVLSIVILRINRINKRINRQLSEKNNQIENQKLNLEDQKRQLEISNHELESFSYSVSHDLRAPLRIIDGYSNIMLNDMKDLDTETKEFLSKIISSSKKMAVLIDDLLKLAKITRQTIAKESFSFSHTVKEIIEELQTYYPGREIKINLRGDITANGDPRLIKIALQNILDNAFKFTSKTENPVIDIGVTKKENKDVFYIKDNGAGFDMNNSGRLFQAFHRLHDSSEFPGSGIGLTIVQRIILRHGGTIWMESKPGTGTTVYFTLC